MKEKKSQSFRKRETSGKEQLRLSDRRNSNGDTGACAPSKRRSSLRKDTKMTKKLKAIVLNAAIAGLIAGASGVVTGASSSTTGTSSSDNSRVMRNGCGGKGGCGAKTDDSKKKVKAKDAKNSCKGMTKKKKDKKADTKKKDEKKTEEKKQ